LLLLLLLLMMMMMMKLIAIMIFSGTPDARGSKSDSSFSHFSILAAVAAGRRFAAGDF